MSNNPQRHLSMIGVERADLRSGGFNRLELNSLAETLLVHLRAQSALCDRLEAIADDLPDRVDRQECLVLARSVISVMHRAHRFEEDSLFPKICQAATGRSSVTQTLERLCFEHWEDEGYADELHESLVDFARGDIASNVDSLAYMLRGFFEGLRRHLAFEREHILPMLRALT